MTIQLAEAHFRNAETTLQTESQQKELAMAMAREVATGQAVVVQQIELQFEREKVEQTAQVGRMNYVIIIDADRKPEYASGVSVEIR